MSEQSNGSCGLKVGNVGYVMLISTASCGSLLQEPGGRAGDAPLNASLCISHFQIALVCFPHAAWIFQTMPFLELASTDGSSL